MRLPRLLPATALLAVGAVLATASAAAAAPLTAYEMPFPCGQAWTGTTRPSHSPSPWSIDWNRTDDVGDPVVAAAAGVVTTAVPNGTRGYGRYVVVDHGNGESTLYGHLQTVNVGIGQTVDQGSLVGLLGDTGNATGPHLHFEERLNGKTVEPWFHGAAFAVRDHAAVAELPRRPDGRQLRRRRHRRGGRVRPRHRDVPDQRAGRPDLRRVRHLHRHPGRRGLGRRRRAQRGRTPRLRPHLLPRRPRQGPSRS